MKPTKRLADASQLTDQLWIGAELSPVDPALATSQLNELVRDGIDAIIDTRIERDDIEWITESMPQIDYLSIGVEDAGLLMPESWFSAGTAYALDQIGDGHVVLVNGQAGINRAPSLALAVLLAQGWDVTTALDHVRQRRPVARIAYAEDAVAWWADQTGVPDDDANRALSRVTEWRLRHDIPHLRPRGI